MGYFAEKAFNSASDSVMSGNMTVNNDLNFSRAMLAFSRKKSYSQQFLKSKSYLHRTFFSFSCQKKKKKKTRICFHRLRQGKIFYLRTLTLPIFSELPTSVVSINGEPLGYSKHLRLRTCNLSGQSKQVLTQMVISTNLG